MSSQGTQWAPETWLVEHLASGESREVSWGELEARGCLGYRVEAGCCVKTSLGGGAAEERLRSVPEVVWRWDAVFQAFVLARIPHDLSGAPDVVGGVGGQGVEVPGGGRPGRPRGPSGRLWSQKDLSMGLHDKHGGADHLGPL